MSDSFTPLDLSIRKLIDIDGWQKIQDNFSAVTGVTIRTVDPLGISLARASGLPRLCRELLKESEVKSKICADCLPTFLGGSGVVDKNLSFMCQAGLCNFIAPLRFKNNALGYIILGPVILVMRKSKEEYRGLADKLGIDLEKLWDTLLDIKVVSFQGIQSLIELIRDVGEYTLKLAYYSSIRKADATVSDSPKLNQLLNALLDVAFQVTGASIGSIMFFSKNNNELTIRASRGIPEDIVSSVHVKPGEGISGIAAKEKKAFLIDEKTTDNRIKKYLKRPYLGSSMVLPISVQDKTVGVINLGALQTSPVRFNANTVSLMNRLVDLSTLAIPPK